MTRSAATRHGSAGRFSAAARRLESTGQIAARQPLLGPGTPARIPPGHLPVFVAIRREDGSTLDKHEARATLDDRPYAKLLSYRGTRDGGQGRSGVHVFSYDPTRLRP